MVSKRYFEQRFLDGLQAKIHAYSCKTGLIQARSRGISRGIRIQLSDEKRLA